MKQKKSNLLFNITATGIIGVGALVSSVSTTIKKSNLSDSQSTQDVSMFANSAYVPTLSSSITPEQVESLQQATIDKYAAMINFYNIQYAGKTSKHIDVQKEVGVMKRNFANFKPVASLTENTTKDAKAPTVHEQKYNFIRQTASNLGFDVVDTYRLEHYQNVQDAQKLYNGLISQGFTQAEAKAQADSYLSSLNKLVRRAKNQMLSLQDYAMDLSSSQQVKTLQKQNATLISRKTKSAKAATDDFSIAQRQALNLFQNNLHIKLKPKSGIDVYGFTNTLKFYSEEGTYSQGDIISGEDLGKLFTYDYDISVGVDLSDYAFDTAEAPVDETTDNYADRVTSITKDFNTFEGSDGTLGLSEFIPGYMAHAKILSTNTTNDSHVATITVRFGVSSINDQDNILWADVNNAFITQSEQNNTQAGVMQINVDVSDKQMQYAAQHWFYLENGDVSITLDHSDYDTTNHSYFVKSMDQRGKLDNLLAMAHVDPTSHEYDLNRHPLYLKISEVIKQDAYVGIPISPEIQWFFDHPDELLHAHQTLALKVTDMNYDEQWLDLSWCIIDLGEVTKIGTDKQSVTSDARDVQGQLEVKTFKWKLPDGTTLNSIRVAYPVDQDTKSQILTANDIMLFWSSMQATADIVAKITKDKWNNMEKKYKADNYMNIILDITNAALVVFGVAITVLNVITFGAFNRDVALSVLFTAIDLAMLVYSSYMLNNSIKDHAKYSKVYEAFSAVPDAIDDIDNFCNVFLGDVNDHTSRSFIIQDPRYNIPDRKKAAVEIIARNEEMFADNSKYTGFLKLLRYTHGNNEWSFHKDLLDLTNDDLQTLSSLSEPVAKEVSTIANLLANATLSLLVATRGIVYISTAFARAFSAAFMSRMSVKSDIFVVNDAQTAVVNSAVRRLVTEAGSFDVEEGDVARAIVERGGVDAYASRGSREAAAAIRDLQAAHTESYIVGISILSTVIAIVAGLSGIIAIIDFLEQVM